MFPVGFSIATKYRLSVAKYKKGLISNVFKVLISYFLDENKGHKDNWSELISSPA